MKVDTTGINNYNEYYTNHYFATTFGENAKDQISKWREEAKEVEETRTPWALIRECSRQYSTLHEKYYRTRGKQAYPMIQEMADCYLNALGFGNANPLEVEVAENLTVPVYLEIKKTNGAPLLWVVLGHSEETDDNIMQGNSFLPTAEDQDNGSHKLFDNLNNEELATKALFVSDEPPRWVIFVGMNQIALIDRNKWNEKRYIHFDLAEIFGRREETTLQAMAVLLHKDTLCPEEGIPLHDELDEVSHKNAAGVSKDLKYALRESIELLGNEILYDMKFRQGIDIEKHPVDPTELSTQCLRYMYRMLFVLFIESRPELGYAPMKAQTYVQGYSLEGLRDIADNVREEIEEVGNGYYLDHTLSKLFELIYNGYPKTEEELNKLLGNDSLHDVFIIEPLKAHIFDREFTPLISNAKLRNKVMLRIITLMSIARPKGKKNERKGRISYSALGINQMGAVYESLLSYRGFIAEEDLYEVKRAKDKFDELDVGYFVTENELNNYTEEERVRYEKGENKGKLRKYDKGSFIYRLAGREREKSASYYTPEVLTKSLVKYALKELLEDKSADEIIELTICEPAMGSAAFLNEAINQLAEAYLNKKQEETGVSISYEDRFKELQKVKMYIADRNTFGIDLNPIAVELAEVSLWLNTIYEGGYVPWFGMQLVNGNSLIGARKQVYRIEQLETAKGPTKWYMNEPERVKPGKNRMPKKQVYHFLTGDPGMANYKDKVIKSLEPEKIKQMDKWNKTFTKPHSEDEIQSLLRLSRIIDDLWHKQVELRRSIKEQTTDPLSIFGYEEDRDISKTTIREKDRIFKEMYKSEKMSNAGPYARLKFAMDYWCALWFWPIDQADELPSRSEFLYDMSLILEGGIVSVSKTPMLGQISFLETENEKLAEHISKVYGDLPEVDLEALCKNSRRLRLVKEIAEQNKFMHWELEFADIFEVNGGFDLILGNPPWIKIEWNEKNILSDFNPSFIIRNTSATAASKLREIELKSDEAYKLYLNEYNHASGLQTYLNQIQNYSELEGLKTNLYKCFLPLGWNYSCKNGIVAYLHPEGVYTESKGGKLRSLMFTRLRKHFQFQNQKNYFEIGHRERYSINIYGDEKRIEFETIANLIEVKTIDKCYELNSTEGQVPGIKDNDGNWSVDGHNDRMIKITKNELMVFSELFDGNNHYLFARLPAVHAVQLIKVFDTIANYSLKLNKDTENVFSTQMWQETGDQKSGLIERKTVFPEGLYQMIYSGPHIGVSNPLYKTPRRISEKKGDYESIDIDYIDELYCQRTNYVPGISKNEFFDHSPRTNWGTNYLNEYKVIMRRRLNLSGERTLIPAIVAPQTSHIHTITGLSFKNNDNLLLFTGLLSSIVYDAIIKNIGKEDVYFETLKNLPILKLDYIAKRIIIRSRLLNCLNKAYSTLWDESMDNLPEKDEWSKKDNRLKSHFFSNVKNKWQKKNTLTSDFERRQALIEIDVLTSIGLGLRLDQLTNVYRIQFPVLQDNEANTWYDKNGRIVFTTNRALTNVGLPRSVWEKIKEAESGTFTKTYLDDTMPGGPVERSIEYVAPFDRCDREKDYETAWRFFEEKYNE
ncbi:Eco57I restriction-modification methylase domain-containing protein [Isachenkonia alkalipeptolytica]|uniref:site-specific DNA-methyltransferase (adenine-specific) n=1 Tax=Isachenkonia alkalipeptolytica TaxID=2565777 RepID=A0AA43XKV2_9CLOT|nr:class I SAM-dependent DNA methyltransferase [Isachenkonia alkalipeptolytica]NBG88129.1 class I SAM-dependent DNA methyltransferase [Isachenkonia alkalipeptolytica]